MLKKKALLALEEGSLFYGTALGFLGCAVGEVVFNTAMTGYQEILSDPSYAKQLVTLTSSHVGNVGTNNEDDEAATPWAKGLIVRDVPLIVSNHRAELPLHDYLVQHQCVGITDVDTRRLTRLLRDKGALRGCIVSESLDPEAAIAKARAFGGMEGLDLAREVSSSTTYTWTEGLWQAGIGYPNMPVERLPYHVVVYDFGVKRNILRCLVDAGCRLTVVPAQTSADDVLALNPDGVFLSNGPGDPAACGYAIEAIKRLLDVRMPLLGICLGHQLLALACGARTLKMKFGHHGANHPVQDIKTSQVSITSQNHGFAVDAESLPTALTATHYSLFDKSLQGIAHQTLPAFGFQGHPEASPGPHDMAYLFENFTHMIAETLKTRTNKVSVCETP